MEQGLSAACECTRQDIHKIQHTKSQACHAPHLVVQVLLAKTWEEIDAIRRRPMEDRATALLRRLKKLVPPQTVAT